jgi:hypothetical protein
MGQPLTYDIKVTAESIKIYICGSLHLWIRRCDLVGFQAWAQGGIYTIEYTTTAGIIKCEYDAPEKSKAILALLDKAELY